MSKNTINERVSEQVNKLLKLKGPFKRETSAEEAYELYKSILKSPVGDVLEIGSASGGTTVLLLDAAAQVKKTVYSIDPYPTDMENKATAYVPGSMNELKENFKRNILDGPYKNIIQYNENTKDCIGKIPYNLSVVFIDGLHELSFVLNEVRLIYPLIIEGGWLYIHDTHWRLGQLSKTEETGLHNVWKIINKSMFREVKSVGSMFCGRK